MLSPHNDSNWGFCYLGTARNFAWVLLVNALVLSAGAMASGQGQVLEGEGFEVTIGGAKPFEAKPSAVRDREEHDPRFVGLWKHASGLQLNLKPDGKVTGYPKFPNVAGAACVSEDHRWESSGNQVTIIQSWTLELTVPMHSHKSRDEFHFVYNYENGLLKFESGAREHTNLDHRCSLSGCTLLNESLNVVSRDEFGSDEIKNVSKLMSPLSRQSTPEDEESGEEQMSQADADDAFPHGNPCDDPVFKRLADEEYSDEVRRKLESLQPRYNLQPLGSRATDSLLTTNLPYANYDRFSVTIPASRLPEGFDPRRELASWPADMNSVPKPGTSGAARFREANQFETSAEPRGLGDVIHIAIGKGYSTVFGNVAVMVTDRSESFFRVSTLEREVRPGVRVRHPVSGSREFGFTENRDGSVTFYTQGLDSPTSIPANSIGGDVQESGWKGFMTGLGEKLGLTTEEAEASVENGSFSNKNVDAKPDC